MEMLYRLSYPSIFPSEKSNGPTNPSWEWESNPRPFPYHGNALPTELPQQLKFSKRAMGIEPTSQAWKASVLPLNHARKKSTVIIIPKITQTQQLFCAFF